jgi:hypothetical protein
MTIQELNAGKASHSPSSALMELTNIDHMSDFNEVVEFLKANLYDIISEVHGFDKLLIDDGKTQLNCPPTAEPNDSHGSLLLRTLSEKEASQGGIVLKREFKVHALTYDEVEIREDVVQAPAQAGHPAIFKENIVTVSIAKA